MHLQAAQTPGPATTESVLAMMDKSAADFRSLTADLENTKYTDVVKDSSTETGQIFVRKDQKMRIEIVKPDPRTILRAGDSLFVYTPKIKRVEEYDLGKNRAMVDQYVLLGFGTKSQNMLKSYDVKLTGEDQLDGRKTFLLELTPKSDDVRHQITKIQMWIDQSSWLPTQQKFYETGSGDYHPVPLHQCDEESEDQRFQVQAGLAKRCNSGEAEGLRSFSTARGLPTGTRDAPKRALRFTPACISSDGRLVRRAEARRLHWFLQKRVLANGRQRSAAFSCANSCSFLDRPQRYPARLPSSRITRWHGTTMETGLVAHARATARTAFGFPSALAT